MTARSLLGKCQQMGLSQIFRLSQIFPTPYLTSRGEKFLGNRTPQVCKVKLVKLFGEKTQAVSTIRQAKRIPTSSFLLQSELPMPSEVQLLHPQVDVSGLVRRRSRHRIRPTLSFQIKDKDIVHFTALGNGETINMHL